MRVLLTEAASSLAYNLTGLLVSEDIFPGQLLELELCDHEERQDAVKGLMYELQDCVYPNLKGVSVSWDLLESFKSADVVLILPKQDSELHGNHRIQINYALLSQIDFQRLDGVFHQRDLDLQEQMSTSASGLLSCAVKITSCLRNILSAAQEETSQTCFSTTLAQYQEEAEFGMPPAAEEWSLASQATNLKLRYENKLLMVVVSITDSKNTRDELKYSESNLVSCISRL